MAELTELTGYFELDSNRLYDVLLNAFEQQPASQAFLQLVGALGCQPALLAQYLGFKFQQANVRTAPLLPHIPWGPLEAFSRAGGIPLRYKVPQGTRSVPPGPGEPWGVSWGMLGSLGGSPGDLRCR